LPAGCMPSTAEKLASGLSSPGCREADADPLQKGRPTGPPHPGPRSRPLEKADV
jgi:hypothetical protein